MLRGPLGLPRLFGLCVLGWPVTALFGALEGFVSSSSEGHRPLGLLIFLVTLRTLIISLNIRCSEKAPSTNP